MRKHRSKIALAALAILAIATVYVFNFVDTPYVIYTPGSAEEVGPMVSVAGGDEGDEGDFLLTTVGVYSEVNVGTYLYQKLNRYAEYFDKEDIFRQGEDRQEYNARQDFNMLSSQSNAIMAAYEEMGIAYTLTTEEVLVLQAMEGYPAADVLRPGDALLAIEGRTFEDMDRLLALLAAYKPGDRVAVTYKRKGEERSDSVELANLAGVGEEPRAGLGVRLASVLAVTPDNPDYRVEVEAGDIGGPSAGLMFALEICNRLAPEDLTGGRRIAGTGEISAEGEVGAIGGVKHKVVAANREDAELFFAPAANAEDAKEMAQQVNPDLTVVPVATLKDALNYLRQSAESGT